MPLVALMDGQREVSSLLSDDECLQLLKLLKFVAPKRGGRSPHLTSVGASTEHRSETAQHLVSEDLIVRSAVTAGWKAQPEPAPRVD